MIKLRMVTPRIRMLAKRVLSASGFVLERQSKSGDIHQALNYLVPKKSKFELIRIGGSNDGGYLLPDDLEGLGACFSPGVGDNSSFESYFVDRNVPCFLADNSVDGPPISSELIHFNKRHVGVENCSTTIRLRDWVQQNSNSDELILQMDIEGSEYDVILDTDTDFFSRFRIIVIEFHFLEMMLNPSGLKLVTACLKKLNLNHFVVHLNPNNCCGTVESSEFKIPRVLEVTYLRKDRSEQNGEVHTFEHPLNEPNLPNARPISLDEIWGSLLKASQ